MQPTQIIRRHGVVQVTSLSLATIYRLMNRGEFPRSVRLSANAVGWRASDVYAWVEGRKATGRGEGAR